MKKILLVSMPFGALERQALGLSIFKAQLAEEGVPCEVRYLNFVFADLIGVQEYCWINIDLPHTALVGEWIFTPCLYGLDAQGQNDYIQSVLRGLWHLDDHALQRILRAQTLAPHFIEYCLQAIPWNDYALVGFTSTFEQNIASLALAQRIKAAHPQVQIVFGGANWEGPMGLELHRCFPFVDYACLGEADYSFPQLVRLVLDKRAEELVDFPLPGVVFRSQGQSILGQGPEPIKDLDTLPIPDYQDYFRDFELSSAATHIVPTLLFESSRGCWWGQKHHCMFCGLNGEVLTYRSKSSQRALKEIKQLTNQWQIESIQAVDNVIPMGYFRDFFPALATTEPDVRLFYEVRASLSRKQVELLSQAGVHHVQPGIESFNNHVLSLMSKGTTALQNIQVLKWCREYEIHADYNLIYGFPGETIEDYQQIFALMDAVRFLNPPTGYGPIRMDRFSPYFQEAEDHGLCNLRPIKPYRYLYPVSKESLKNIAYYFDYDLRPGLVPENQPEQLINKIEDWKANPESGELRSYELIDGTLVLVDTRTHAHYSKIVLQGMDKAVYQYCDAVRSLTSVYNYLAKNFADQPLTIQAVQGFLDALVDGGYMLRDGAQYLSLGLRYEG